MFRQLSLTLTLLFMLNAGKAERDYDAIVYRVCANPWQPIMTCENNGTASGLNQQEVDRIAHEVGWVHLEGEEKPKKNGTTYYRYHCMPLQSMLADLADPKGDCHLGISLTVSGKRTERGIKFSFPIYRGNLAVLTNARYTRGNGWGFARPVTISVWVIVLLTGVVVVPFLLVVFEYISEQEKLPKNLSDFTTGMTTAMWNSMTMLLRVGGESIRSAEARVVMTGYAFLVLIIITVYTANMTANLTVSKITATVNSLHDLPEARVGVVPVYKHRLEEHGITKFYTIESNDTTMDVALNALATGEADALAMASEWIAKVLLDRGCRDSVYMFNLEMESFDYALPFPARVPSRVMDRVNNAIINLSEDSQLQRIADDFGSNHDCLRSPIDDPLTVLGIWQVYGVWVLMSACIFLASMISVARCIMRRYKVYTVRMPAFVQFEGEERDIEMMAAPVAGTSNGQGSGEKVENTQAVNEIQRELREMRVELLQQIKQANRRRPKPRFQRGWKLPIGKESKK